MANNADLDFAVDTAQKAGEILTKYYGKKLTKKAKSFPGDFATEADLESEQLIIEAIQDKYPHDNIVAEESGKHDKTNSEYTWIVDPLDGTHNFAKNSGPFGVLIARAHGERIVLGVAYDPIHNILATAAQGQGMFLNRVKTILSKNPEANLPVSASDELRPLLAPIGEGDMDRGSAIGGVLDTLDGRCKVYASNAGFVWDFAAAALLFSEAGWTVTDVLGNEYGWDGKVEFGWPGIIAAPEGLHGKILELLRD